MRRELPVLDLHGITHRDVISELTNFYFWEGHGDSIIVTGKSIKMREIVEEWLVDNDYTFQEDYKNFGRLKVYE